MTEFIHHTHSHRHFNKKRLVYAMFITTVMLIAEVIGGLLSNSLALLSDAAHMFSHLFALGISYVAIILTLRPATNMKTYGYYRAEILAAFINGLTLFIIVFAIIYGAYERFKNPIDIRSAEMFVVAVAGLIVNLVTAFLLKSGSHEDMNIKGAFLHALGDLISSVGVVIAALVIYFTKFYILDTIVSIIIAGIIVYWAIQLIRDATNILLEGTPKDLDLEKVKDSIKNIVEKEIFIHHIHTWQIGTNIYALTAHISADIIDQHETTCLIKSIDKMLKERFNIYHATIQFEYADHQKIETFKEVIGEDSCTITPK